MVEAATTVTPGVTDRDRDRTDRTDSGDIDGVATTLPVKHNIPSTVIKTAVTNSFVIICQMVREVTTIWHFINLIIMMTIIIIFTESRCSYRKNHRKLCQLH